MSILLNSTPKNQKLYLIEVVLDPFLKILPTTMGENVQKNLYFLKQVKIANSK